jgi:hypothetical protein
MKPETGREVVGRTRSVQTDSGRDIGPLLKRSERGSITLGREEGSETVPGLLRALAPDARACPTDQ